MTSIGRFGQWQQRKWEAQEEIERSRLKVFRAKQRKAALGLPTDLTTKELDAVLPVIRVRRARRRLTH